jgi:hypothetical protein
MPLANYTYNNSIISTQVITPLYANYGYHPSSGTIPKEANILSVRSVAPGHWRLADK